MVTGQPGQSLEIVQLNVGMEFKQEQEHAQILHQNLMENLVMERLLKKTHVNSKNAQVCKNDSNKTLLWQSQEYFLVVCLLWIFYLFLLVNQSNHKIF